MQFLIRIIFGAILFLIFLAGAIFIVFTFGKQSYDTTPFTNAGFAIFAGCASVTFAWARNLKEMDDLRDLHKINKHGESLFLSALCFIIASLLKYIMIHRVDIINEKILSYAGVLLIIINIMGAVLFFVAYLNAWAAILGLMRILFRKSLEHTKDSAQRSI